MFPEAPIQIKDFVIYKHLNPFLNLEVSIDQYSEEVQDKLKIWTDPQWMQDEYLIQINSSGLIDPETGWAMTLDKKLIYPSLGFSRAPHVRKPNLIKAFNCEEDAVRLGAVISLRDTGEENYFHFFNDVLSKIFFLRDQGIDINDFKIIVSDRLYNKPYFQFLMKNEYMSSLQWYVQKNEWIHFSQAVFCKPLTHTKKYFDEITNSVKIQPNADGRRIFLTRSIQSLRYVENMADVRSLLLKYKFEIIDSAVMSLSEQALLFSECRYLIAVHGAGIVNIVFRKGNPLALLEIVQPSDYIPFHYIMLSKMYNYQYDVLLGKQGQTKGSGGFSVDLLALENKISLMINS